MKKYQLATIVNFCTNESRFIQACLEQALKFSAQVIIPVCDHFFDGTKEDQKRLNKIYHAFPECLFVEYPFIPNKIPKKIFRQVRPANFWHSLSRLLASELIDESVEKILFLDADEIADSQRFIDWLECNEYQEHNVIKLANFWYFREPCYQAEQWEDSIVLAKRKAIKSTVLLNQEERNAIYDLLPSPKERMVVGLDGVPMFHHYSWVRTEQEMLKKVGTWGHSGDKNWVQLVKNEFLTPFKGIDFVHHYPCRTINPIFNLPLNPVFEEKGSPNLIRLSEENVLSTIKMRGERFWSLILRGFP